MYMYIRHSPAQTKNNVDACHKLPSLPMSALSNVQILFQPHQMCSITVTDCSASLQNSDCGIFGAAHIPRLIRLEPTCHRDSPPGPRAPIPTHETIWSSQVTGISIATTHRRCIGQSSFVYTLSYHSHPTSRRSAWTQTFRRTICTISLETETTLSLIKS